MSDRKWKEFQVGGKNGLFRVKSSVSEIDMKNLNLEGGSVPYITRSNINNGISRYVAKEQGGYLKNKGNVITIGLDTQTVFYQPKDFFTGQNIQVIEHDRMSRDVANFLISLFKVQMRKFNWGGNGATLKRLNALKIMLPVDKNGDPDWDYIEYEGGRVYKEKIGKVLKYVRQKQKKLEEDQRILNKLDLVESKWKPFKLEDVATILSGRD